MPIDKDTFWGNNHYNHPPLSDKMIRKAERKLWITLPPLFIELLRIQNGGYTKGFVFPMNVKTSWSNNHVPLNKLNGIILDKDFRTAQNIMESKYMRREWGLPRRQILLAYEGSCWVSLDYRRKRVPSVRWLDADTGEDTHVADTFEQFINGLVPEADFDFA